MSIFFSKFQLYFGLTGYYYQFCNQSATNLHDTDNNTFSDSDMTTQYTVSSCHFT